MNLASMCLNSMSMTVSDHICYFSVVKESRDIYLLDGHIWKCQNLNSHIS